MKNTKKNKDLGIFYTPTIVVDLIIDLMAMIKDKEDEDIRRWSSHKPPHYPSIIDPACGEGIFLKRALAKKLTTPDHIFGVDLDEDVVNKWERINLLNEFGGDKKRLKAHFFHQNGLNPLDLSQQKKYYSGKVRWSYLKKEKFDFVLGNPPYGGMGIYEDMKQLLESILKINKVTTVETNTLENLFGETTTKQTKVTRLVNTEVKLPHKRIEELKLLSKTLLSYKIWKNNKKLISGENCLFKVSDVAVNYKDLLEISEIERLKSFPIEVLFLERFINLAKSPAGHKAGGRMAIILPEGVFANSTLDYVRNYISEHTKVLGIISLPRDTFKDTGTNAKTSILLLEKMSKPIAQNYQVFLASIDKLDPNNFAIILNRFKEWIYEK